MRNTYTALHYDFSLSMKNNIPNGESYKSQIHTSPPNQGTCLVVNDNNQWCSCRLRHVHNYYFAQSLNKVPDTHFTHAGSHATNGVDVVLTPGTPRWVGVTISHTSAAPATAVRVGVEGELWLAICLRPRIPIRVQESWTRCRIHTQNPSSMKKTFKLSETLN